MKPKNTAAVILLALIFSLTGCSKEKQTNILVDAVTNGRWIVVSFTEAGSDLTSDFTPYEFQFYENNTVQAINGTTIINGTWSANIDARTISANFPGNNTTLNRLNDNWLILNSTMTMVEANPVNTGRTAYLKLNKK